MVPNYLLDLMGSPSFTTRWGPTANKMLELLDQMLTYHGEQLAEGGYDPSGARVLANDWRSRCIQSDIKTDTFRQAKKRLLEHGEIHITGGYVTRVKA